MEFLGATLVLLIPAVYLILTLGQLQAATFAAESGARESARLLAQTPELAEGLRQAEARTALAFGDHDLAAGHALTVSCSAEPCLQAGSELAVTVTAQVPLPLVPPVVSGALPLALPVTASHRATVDPFLARP